MSEAPRPQDVLLVRFFDRAQHAVARADGALALAVLGDLLAHRASLDIVWSGQETAPPAGGSGGVPIASKWAGKCTKCGLAYAVGEIVRWTKGEGCSHTSCT